MVMQTIQGLAQAQAHPMNGFIVLQKSLGSGWSDDACGLAAPSKVLRP